MEVVKDEELKKAEQLAEGSVAQKANEGLDRHIELMLYVHSFLQGAHQAIFYPTLAFAISEVMEFGAVWAGMAFFIFLISGFLCLGRMPMMLKSQTPYNLMIISYAIRIVAGAMYTPVAFVSEAYGNSVGLAITMLSRVVHGLSIFSMALGMAYIGVKAPNAEKPVKIAIMTTSLSLGLVAGPLFATFLVTLTGDNVLLASGYAGATNSITSILFLVALYFIWDDKEMLAKKGPPPKEMEPTTKRYLLIVSLFSVFSFAGVVALEAILGLTLYHEFGLDPEKAWPIWLLQAVMQIVGAWLFARLHKWLGAKAATVVLFVITFSFGATIINWTNFYLRIPFWLLTAGLSGKIIGMFGALNLIAVHTTQRMPPYLQAAAAAANVSAGMVGRAIGPILTGWAFDYGRWVAPESYLADNLAFLMQYSYVAISCFILMCFWSLVLDTSMLNAGEKTMI